MTWTSKRYSCHFVEWIVIQVRDHRYYIYYMYWIDSNFCSGGAWHIILTSCHTRWRKKKIERLILIDNHRPQFQDSFLTFLPHSLSLSLFSKGEWIFSSWKIDQFSYWKDSSRNIFLYFFHIVKFIFLGKNLFFINYVKIDLNNKFLIKIRGKKLNLHLYLFIFILF